MKRTAIIAIAISILVIVGGFLAYPAISRYRQEKGLDAAQAANTLPAYENYIRQYPNGLYVRGAKGLLEQRRAWLEDKRGFAKRLESVRFYVTTYFPEFGGVTNAPSGGMFGLALALFGAVRFEVTDTNPELRRKLWELESLLNPVYQENRRLLDKLRPGGGGIPDSQQTAYIRSYPARQVSPLLDPIAKLVEAEKAKLKPFIAELEEYERKQKAARSN